MQQIDKKSKNKFSRRITNKSRYEILKEAEDAKQKSIREEKRNSSLNYRSAKYKSNNPIRKDTRKPSMYQPGATPNANERQQSKPTPSSANKPKADFKKDIEPNNHINQNNVSATTIPAIQKDATSKTQANRSAKSKTKRAKTAQSKKTETVANQKEANKISNSEATQSLEVKIIETVQSLSKPDRTIEDKETDVKSKDSKPVPEKNVESSEPKKNTRTKKSSKKNKKPKVAPDKNLSSEQPDKLDTTRKTDEPEKPKKKVVEPIHPSEINPKMLLTEKEALNPKIAGLIAQVNQYLQENLMVSESSKIVIAVSGGVDSVVMLDVFAQLAKSNKYQLSVLHFNHSLRGGQSDKDEELVKKLAQNYNLKFYSSKENISQYSDKYSVSIEQAARIRRYKYYERITTSVKAHYIAMAHTADDSAETFLLNLIRGTGLTGLSGIPERRLLIKSIMLVRPFLKTLKSNLIEYAKERKLNWNEDESNSLSQFTRNKIRNELIPNLKNNFSDSIIDLINRSATHIKGADNFINEHVQAALQLLIKDRRKDRFALYLPLFQTYSEFMQGEIIQAAVSSVFKIQSLPLQTIDRLLNFVDNSVGSICDINKNIFALRDREHIIFSFKQPSFDANLLIDRTGTYKLGNYKIVLSETDKKSVKFSLDTNIEYFDMENIPTILYLRKWREGDAFQPLGMEGTVKVSDLLTNLKVPLIDKQNVLVLATRTEIIWLCGFRISNNYKVQKDSKKILKAEIFYSK